MRFILHGRMQKLIYRVNNTQLSHANSKERVSRFTIRFLYEDFVNLKIKKPRARVSSRSEESHSQICCGTVHIGALSDPAASPCADNCFCACGKWNVEKYRYPDTAPYSVKKGNWAISGELDCCHSTFTPGTAVTAICAGFLDEFLDGAGLV